MAFFLEWSVEAKFFFVFGCLIGIVLPSASLIRVKNRQSPVEHQSLNDGNHAERGEVPQVSASADEVFFGVRAMEESDVDGLWNSKTSTPLHTPLQSPTISTRDSSSIRQALAKLSHSRRGSSSTSVSKFDLSEPPSRKQGVTEAECLKNSRAKLTSLDEAQRVGNVNLVLVHGGDTENVKASASIPLTPLPVSAAHDQRFASTMQGNHSFDAGNAKTKDVPIASDPKHLETLDHMEAHRRFHAAESGQFRPRARHYSKTSVSSTYSQPTQSSCDGQQAPRAVSWPTANRHVVSNMAVPQDEAIRKAGPHVIPFRAFVEMHPPPKVCPSAWTEKTQDRMEEQIQRAKHVSRYTITNSKYSQTSSTDSSPATPETPLSSNNVSIYSQVARKVNHGFELLPAGTLDKPAPVKTFGSTDHQVLSQQTNGRRISRKLQKRDRSRSKSLGSDRSGNEVRDHSTSVR